MKKHFYSNGKLLLTGEYAVINGAKVLALPTVFGQHLTVKQTNSETICWKSYNYDQSIWIDIIFEFSEIIEKTFMSENSTEIKLAKILHQTYNISPTLLAKNKGYEIETSLTFPKDWGLGSSSTLINNIAKWQKINPYQLLKNTFGGSGYDIACAENNQPILFSLIDETPLVETINFNPIFSENLYFVYLNKKQNSSEAIAEYIKKRPNISEFIPKINRITTGIQKTKSVLEFANLLWQHEKIISNLLSLETIQKRFFSDFKGVIKSLGAWGGDFVLAVSTENPSIYFAQKGFKTIIPYKKMIL